MQFSNDQLQSLLVEDPAALSLSDQDRAQLSTRTTYILQLDGMVNTADDIKIVR